MAVIRDPDLVSGRAKPDASLRFEIKRVWGDKDEVNDVRKFWRQVQRKGFHTARCTVSRLMKQLGIKGISRARTHKTGYSNTGAQCPRDHANRQFRRTSFKYVVGE